MTKWTEADVPTQHGKVALITGANSGLGREATRVLADAQATVVMACRNESKAQAALESIQSQNPQAQVAVMALDLSSLASIKEFAQAFTARFDRLDVLMNNAGVMALPQCETEDGFEMQFGVNHLGHFALTGHLWPLLLSTEGSRIVNVSSNAHKFGRMNWADVHNRKRYNAWAVYGQSKLANLLFTLGLNKRLQHAGTGAIAVAAHPGYAATHLFHSSAEMAGSKTKRWLADMGNRLMAQPADMGALPQLYAATAPDVQSGDYYGPGGFMQGRGYPKKVACRPAAQDEGAAEKLWGLSEEQTGVCYGS